jgi:XTP/dITP diphosphohydrolase
MPGRIVLLVTSPRLPAGLLTAAAWDLVRVHPVFAEKESVQTAALRAAGADVRIVAEPTADGLIAAAEAAAQGTVIWLGGPHGDAQLARQLGLKLAADPGLAEMELLYGSWDPPGARLLDAVAVMDRLHADDAWKRAQTHQSLARYLLEEAYEAYDAIVNDDLEALRGEIGDVLLQVLLHARMAEELPEDERWTIDDVAGEFVAKMIRRNPHVFEPGRATDDLDEILANWNAAKRAEAAAHPKRSPSTLGQALATLASSSRGEDAAAALRTALEMLDNTAPRA